MAMSANTFDDARTEREMRSFPSAVDNPDIQEALSHRYSNKAIVVLKLKSGRFAIFNNTRELCGIVWSLEQWPPPCWREPLGAGTADEIVARFAPKPSPKPQLKIDLKELGLI